jgi:hypothetical protein
MAYYLVRARLRHELAAELRSQLDRTDDLRAVGRVTVQGPYGYRKDAGLLEQSHLRERLYRARDPARRPLRRRTAASRRLAFPTRLPGLLIAHHHPELSTIPLGSVSARRQLGHSQS